MDIQSQTQAAKILAGQLALLQPSVLAAIQLLDDGNTVPFIARYRKDSTGGIDDQALRKLEAALGEYRSLEEKRESILLLIDGQGKLTEELKLLITEAKTKAALDDLYRPYRPKRRTRAGIAREQGLEPLAGLLKQEGLKSAELEKLAASLIDPNLGVTDSQAAIQGAMDILAEDLSDQADLRSRLRSSLKREASLTASPKKQKNNKLSPAEFERKAATYRSYENFSTPLNRLRGHQILAMNRGEAEGFLNVAVASDEAQLTHSIRRTLPRNSAASTILDEVSTDSWKRLIEPSLTTELRRELKDQADEEAVEIFAKNLRNTLLSPPLRDKCVLAFDPGYRNGCKLAVTAADGQVLDTAVIHPVPHSNRSGSETSARPEPFDSRQRQAASLLDRWIQKFKIEILALGNGTATRETEDFIRLFLEDRGLILPLVIVNEAGASVYSASEVAAREFPDLDVSVRGAISLARRLQDPLAELVKIDPASIGVGQYQHDIDQNRLGDRLKKVVEDAVNEVGVDLNTASFSILSYISGINATIAKNIYETRLSAGPFKKRTDLKKVPRLGPKAYEQCAGFLRIQGGSEALDNTSVHPESYPVARKLLDRLAIKESTGNDRISERVNEAGLNRLASELNCGPATLADIAAALDKPGRDSRQDLDIQERSNEIRDIADLKVGMRLPGVVRNVAAFGAFVDIGVHQDGLVHVSEMADHFVSDPGTIVSTGDRVNVRVLAVDPQLKRISLSLKK